MEEDLLKKRTEAFCMSQRQLCWSGKYTLLNDKSMPLDYPKELKDCLNDLLKTHNEGKEYRAFRLETKPNHAPHIRCVFTMDFDPAKGFLVRQMFLRDTDTNKEETLRIQHNRQIPCNQAVIKKFPKVKPWQKHLKGKYGI